MEKDENIEWRMDIKLPGTSVSDLRGKQSVRATFRLSAGAIDAISIVSAHLGIKQKSLFDHLMEDTGALHSIADEIRRARVRQKSKVQKTYVVSRKTLSLLEEISKRFSAPRDALVEVSIQRLLPIIAREREKHEKRKALFEKISDHFEEGKKILAEAGDSLGEGDRFLEKLEAATAACESARRSMESFIERGKIIEEFHFGPLETDEE